MSSQRGKTTEGSAGIDCALVRRKRVLRFIVNESVFSLED